MLKNYLVIAYRNLLKYKFYSSLNILGLAIGIAAFLFILLYTQDELSYDQYHEHSDDIVRVDFHAKLGENDFVGAINAAPVGPAMVSQYPEVKSFCRFRDRGSFLVKVEDISYKEEKVIYTDSTFFEFFSNPLVQGDPKEALTAPSSIVFSEKMAVKYFGNENPIGKTVVLDNEDRMKVTGVMAEIPSNTHFSFDFLISLGTLPQSRGTDWGSTNFNTYVLLEKGTDLVELEEKIQIMFRNGFEPVLEAYVGTTWDEFMAAGNYAFYTFTKLTDIHLHSDKGDELGANGDFRYIYIFSLIGLFLLVIAGINFVNLTTARSINRAKEVGVRKTVGADKSSLIGQFLSESILIGLIALILAYGLLFLMLPSFNELALKDFSYTHLLSPSFISIALSIALFTGLVSGIYPSLHLSKFNAVKVLKGAVMGQRNKSSFRNGLVVFQFFITTLLIVGTVVVSRQLTFMQQKKLGYDREQVLILNDAYALGEQAQTFKQRMKSHPDVQHASLTGFLPVLSNRNTSSFFKGKNPTQENAVLLSNWYVDFDYIATMGMEIIHGRDFDKALATDSLGLIINEELVRQLKFEDPLGEIISGYTSDELSTMEHYKIIGVVKDFNYASLREHIAPLALFIGNNRGALSFRLRTNDVSEFIIEMERTWNEMAPGQPFSYQFMDERFSRMYESEARLGNIVTVFSLLTIFIACMGLLGLATFIAQQRTKEIGIRKILGAGIPNLVFLLCKDFGVLILIAFILAAPLGWYVMNNWLEDFAFAISMGPGIFLTAGGIILVLAMISIIYQASRVAIIDPIDTLKGD